MKRFLLFYVFCFLLVVLFTGCPSPTASDLLYRQDGLRGDENGYAIRAARDRFFRPDVLHHFSVTFDRAEWDRLNREMLEYQSSFGSLRIGAYYRADLAYSGPDGSAAMPSVGFRTRGNTTRQVPENPSGTFRRAHFHLKFNETFNLAPGSSTYRYYDDRRLAGQRSLILKNDGYSLHEHFSYTFMNRIGLKAPKTTLAQLILRIKEPDDTVTEVDFGVYTAIESVNRSFLQANWPDDNRGDLYKSLWQQGGPATLSPLTGVADGSSILGVADWRRNYRPSYNLETNEDILPRTHWRLVHFTEQLDRLSGPALKTWLDTNFEIQDFLKWMAANLLIGMPDDYRAMGNNYFMYFPLHGKSSLVPFDYDHSFGRGWYPYNTESVGIFEVPELNGSGSKPLVDKVLAIPEYRTAYVNYLEQLLDTEFTHEKFMEFYSGAASALDGQLIFGSFGGVTSLPADPGYSDYFAARTARTRMDILEYRSGEALPELEIQHTDGFSDAGSGVWSVPFGAASTTTNITVTAEVTAGAVPQRVRFELSYIVKQGQTSTVQTVNDTSAPFSASFSVPRAEGPYRLTVTAYNAANELIGQDINTDFARTLYTDYTSIQSLGGGNYRFRFRPAHAAYGETSAAAGNIYLRGGLSENGVDWAIPILMSGPDGSGYYTVDAVAAPGQFYKFFRASSEFDPVSNPWSGAWYVDLHSIHRQLDGDLNSIVP